MQWWNDFVTWIQTTDGRQTVYLAAIILLALVAGILIAAAVFRSALSRLLRQQEHERKNAVIATLVDAAVDASAWNALSQSERILSDRASAQAETHLRLLPVKGSGVAANWVAHELADLKHTSSTGGYQTQASVGEFRDRLVQWRDKPNRARKSFLGDLERWRFSETSRPETPSSQRTETAPSTARAPQPERQAQPVSPGPVAVGSGSSDSGTSYQRPSGPTIVLPTAPDNDSDDETRRLLDDVDRLEVPSRERPVEELPPVEAAPARSAETPEQETEGREQPPITARAAD